MKLKAFVLIVSIATVLTIFISHCGPLKSSNLSTGVGGSSRPGLLHVFNGQTLGVYTAVGGYGYNTQGASVFSTGSLGGNGQVAQNTLYGTYYMGTSSACANCNYAVYFNGSTGGFLFSQLSTSRQTLLSNGLSEGVAVNPQTSTLYVTDSVNGRVFFLNSQSLGYKVGGSTGFNAPTSRTAQYVAVDSQNGNVLVTDPLLGSVFALNGATGDVIPTSPTVLTLTGGSCSSASNIGFIAANNINNIAYVLCDSSIIYLNAGTTPSYKFGNLNSSTFATSGISQTEDLYWDSGSNVVFVAGGTGVNAFSGITANLLGNIDVSSGDCTGTPSLTGLVYDSGSHSVYAVDHANSRIITLSYSSGTFNFQSTTCSQSSFSTSTDVPSPTKISFY